MNESLKAVVLSLSMSQLASCSAVAEGEGRAVEAGPLSCLMMSQDSSVAITSVTCRVVIDNAAASTEGIDVSVTNILQVSVLPGVCRSFRVDEVARDPAEFDSQVHAELASRYKSSGIGWTVSAVDCQVEDG